MARKTTLGKVREAIADAAIHVAEVADKHVVHPVGEKLGLLDSEPAKPKKKVVAKKAKPAVKAAVKSETTAKVEEAVPVKKAKSTVKSRMMTKVVPAAKPSTKSSHEPENRTGRSR